VNFNRQRDSNAPAQPTDTISLVNQTGRAASTTKGIPMRPVFYSFLLLLVGACTPTVQVAAPKEPITINLNVKIEHEVRVKVDKELDALFDEDSELF
jgi:hypothetical protein